MIEIACTCDDGAGLPHSHVLEPKRVPNPTMPAVRMTTMADTGWVRLWVDWKAVARAS